METDTERETEPEMETERETEPDMETGTETETETRVTTSDRQRADERFVSPQVRASGVLSRALETKQERGLAEHVDEALAPFDADHVLAFAEQRFEIELVELACVGEPIEIRVHERRRRFGVVVEQREGRALNGNVVRDAERACEGAHEERFPCTEITFEDHEVTRTQLGTERPGQRFGRCFVREIERRFEHVRSSHEPHVRTNASSHRQERSARVRPTIDLVACFLFESDTPEHTADRSCVETTAAVARAGIGCDPRPALIQPRGSADGGPRRASRHGAPRWTSPEPESELLTVEARAFLQAG